MLDLLGFSLILLLLPFLGQEFGAHPGLIGLLSASNAAAGLIGAPIVARLWDRFGRRPLLILGLATLLSLPFAYRELVRRPRQPPPPQT